MFVSVVTLLEIERGVLLVERREPAQGALLRSWLDKQLLPAFEGHLLAFDAPIARRCAALHVPDPKPCRDAMIAATALEHRLTVAKRHVADFEGCCVARGNPFDGVPRRR